MATTKKAARGKTNTQAKTAAKASPVTKKKTSAKAKPAKTSPNKTSPNKKAAKPSQASTKVVLLSGGNPQIAKGDGDAPVQAYIAAMPEWKRDIGERLDKLITRNVPGVRKAVKWNSPMYGIEGSGWFMSFHVFARYVKVTFFFGTALRPLPPDPSKDKNTRYVNVHEGQLDEAQMAAWVKQAAALPGWMSGGP